MIRYLVLFCFLTFTSQAGLPPTTSKVSGDSADITTFKYQFPNFTGTHTGTTISLGVNSIAGGGTGAATKAGGFDALSPMTTSGDLIYGGASGTGTRLAAGTNGYILSMVAGLPAWVSAPAASLQLGVSSISSSVAHAILIDDSGTLNGFSNFKYNNSTGNFNLTGKAIFESDGTTNVPLVVKGIASQATALTQWKNSNGTVLANMNENGYLTSTGLLASGDVTTFGSKVDAASSGSDLFTIKATSGNASGVPLIVKGASSQSAVLTQWQNNNGTILANMNQSGLLTSVGLLSNGTISTVNAPADISSANSDTFAIKATSGNASGVPIIAKGAIAQSASLQQWQNNTGTVLASINSTGQYIGDGSQLTGISGGGITIDSSSITSGGANRVLFESATNKVSENSAFTFDGTAVLSAPNLSAVNTVAANVPLSIKAHASQSGALTQWLNSNGTALLNIDSSGNIAPTTAAQVALNIQGVASQSGNLLNFKNSTGTVLVNFASGGALTVNSNAAATIPVTIQGAASQSGNLLNLKNNTGTVLSNFSSGGALTLNPNVAATVIQVNKGAASQSGDLLQFQNNNGTVLSNFASGGNLSLFPNVAATVPLSIKANASQSGNLTQWLNSNGTALSLINSSGALKHGAFTLPLTDGTNGQMLTTNGSGTVTWANEMQYKRRTTTQSSATNSTAFSTDNTITGFTLSTGLYRVSGVLIFQVATSTSADCKIAFDITTSTVNSMDIHGTGGKIPTTAIGHVSNVLCETDAVTCGALSMPVTATNFAYQLNGLLDVTNAGTLDLLFGANSAVSGAYCQIQPNSFIQLNQM